MKFERWDAIAENVSEGEIKWANKREREGAIKINRVSYFYSTFEILAMQKPSTYYTEIYLLSQLAKYG